MMQPSPTGSRCCATTARHKKYYHDIEGYNGRLDSLQAGLLHVKLNHLAKWNAQRRERADEYKRLLASAGGCRNPALRAHMVQSDLPPLCGSNRGRVALMNHLKKAGIGTGIHYPIPLHLQKAYSSMNYRLGDFPVAERVAEEIVSLPMYPQLTAEQQARVVEEILALQQYHRSKNGGE